MLLFCVTVYSQKNEPIQIDIDAGHKIANVTKWFNGTNIEDLNNQTNGSMFSQLIHDESFEENIEPDFLNLKPRDYSNMCTWMRDET